MPFSIMQRSLDPAPTVESLKPALLGIPGFAPADAPMIAQDAFGVLMKNLSYETAMAAHHAFAREGIETEAVDEADLNTQIDTRFLRRAACRADALIIFDPLGREVPIHWPHVMLVSAGRVRTTRERPLPRPNPPTDEDSILMFGDREPLYRQETVWRILVDIVLQRAVLRYSFAADTFDFRDLGERRTRVEARDTATFIQDLAQLAPHVILNRGAYMLKHGEPASFPYPSKNAFLEEQTWLLWKISRAARS